MISLLFGVAMAAEAAKAGAATIVGRYEASGVRDGRGAIGLRFHFIKVCLPVT